MPSRRPARTRRRASWSRHTPPASSSEHRPSRRSPHASRASRCCCGCSSRSRCSPLPRPCCPTFGLVVAARFLAGLPHGAYFGVASLVAASLMGPGSRGKGIAFVLGGLTIANVIGVPAITLLGQADRMARRLPRGRRRSSRSPSSRCSSSSRGSRAIRGRPCVASLTLFRRGQVWFALGIGAIGFGGFFAVYTFVAPIITTVSRLPQVYVALALVVAGSGMTAGNFIGGHLADVRLVRGVRDLLRRSWWSRWSGSRSPRSTSPARSCSCSAFGAAVGGLSPLIQTRLINVGGGQPDARGGDQSRVAQHRQQHWGGTRRSRRRRGTRLPLGDLGRSRARGARHRDRRHQFRRPSAERYIGPGALGLQQDAVLDRTLS